MRMLRYRFIKKGLSLIEGHFLKRNAPFRWKQNISRTYLSSTELSAKRRNLQACLSGKLKWSMVIGGAAALVASIALISKVDVEIQEVWEPHTFVVRIARTFYTVVIVVCDYKITQFKNWFRVEDERLLSLTQFHHRTAQKIKELCFVNGGICCKMGQIASTMVFLLPVEYIKTLKKLQDNCAPNDFNDVKKTFFEECGQELEEYFDEFDSNPIGVATLAQVHLARLKTGERVAVKIQHRKLNTYVESDIKIAEMAVKLSERLQSGLDLDWLVDGIKKFINEERNFMIEAKNMEDIRKISEINPVCVVPKVYYKSRRLLIMEYIDGARIDNRSYTKENNINPRELSYELHKIFSQMIFYLGIIHSDPHPGNILVKSIKKPSFLYKIKTLIIDRSWPSSRNFEIALRRFLKVDHGLCCRIDKQFQYNYARLWKSIITANEKGIKKYSEVFFNNPGSTAQPKKTSMHRMFASMITGRSWKTISGYNSKESANYSEVETHNTKGSSVKLTNGVAQEITDAEKEDIRYKMRDRRYIDMMGVILSAINSEFLLILKTSDLLRSLDNNIGARECEGSFLDIVILTLQFSSDIIYKQDREQELINFSAHLLAKELLSLGFPELVLLMFSPGYWNTLIEWACTKTLCCTLYITLALREYFYQVPHTC